jgi:hypothetical protein
VRDAPTAIHANTAGDYDLGIWGYAYNINDPDDYVNAIYGPESATTTRWKHRNSGDAGATITGGRPEKRWQLLRQKLSWDGGSPYIEILWKPWTYLVSDKVRTEAGPFVTPPSLQTVHKNEYVWLEK